MSAATRFLALAASAAMCVSTAHAAAAPPAGASAGLQPATKTARGSQPEEDRQSMRSARRLAEAFRTRHGGLRHRPLDAGEKITLSTRKADLVEVLRAFAILADVNLVVDPEVRGQVTVELRDVAWEQALAVILRTHGLAAELDGRIWRVHSP